MTRRNVAPLENLHSLHVYEEELRTKSLTTIKTDEVLSDHLNIISEAMNLIYAFSYDYKHHDDDELTYQLFGVRLFNAAGASIKLALSGYYQKAFDHIRDVLETYFLVDYLTTHSGKLDEWKSADKKARMKLFGPGVIRDALDKRDGFTGRERTKIYSLISEYASHASYPGFMLVTNERNLGEVGPFYDRKKLEAWLQELAKRLSHAAVILAHDQRGADRVLLATRSHYLSTVNLWVAKYLHGKLPTAS
jgi:hypothetical protein